VRRATSKPRVDLEALEFLIANYERQHPEEAKVSGILRCLQRTAPEACAGLILFRAAAEQHGKRWRREGFDGYGEHKEGLFEERITGARSDGEHECNACNGVRFVRMVNYKKEAVVIVDKFQQTRTYEPGESWIVRYDSCSRHLTRGRNG